MWALPLQANQHWLRHCSIFRAGCHCRLSALAVGYASAAFPGQHEPSNAAGSQQCKPWLKGVSERGPSSPHEFARVLATKQPRITYLLFSHFIKHLK
mmetsp:Transcript_19671/g.54891  ORF Transcript_19671/g.54891 Transcript_19671/m.54891 type:complete len:97 (+) Transcript_19671:976-1266(+)